MSSTENSALIDSPYGLLKAAIEKDELISLNFIEKDLPRKDDAHPLFDLIKDELAAYFEGKLKKFTIPLNPQGTTFQKKVWTKVRRIQFGARISYAELSEMYGDKKAIRAVAAANGANPIAILIPCHRVIGSHGEMTGYAWGLERKKKLLQHEMQHTPQHDLFG